MRNNHTLELVQVAQTFSNEVKVDVDLAHEEDDQQINKCKEVASENEQSADASTSTIAEDELELHPLRHPRMPIITPSRYFVNKRAVVCSNYAGKIKPLKPEKSRKEGNKSPRYNICIDRKKAGFKVDEAMAYTFWDQPFDVNVHWIHHKDGNRGNCAWDNLFICDLGTLQQLEIARLEKLNPGTKYTVVRDVHDTQTFERYLVSDAGEIYSLISQKVISPPKKTSGYGFVSLSSDTNTVQATPTVTTMTVHRIVLQSFLGRRVKGFEIDHCTETKEDNSLQNLAFIAASENLRRVHQTARDLRKTQGDVPNKCIARPLPPITEETRWSPIGTLPWNGRSFNQYEVSDMGHVREIKGHKLVLVCYTERGDAYVQLHCDRPDERESHSKTGRVRYSQVRVSRLVANAFVDGRSETQDIANHLNGDKQDNRAENLRWISRQCNSLAGRARQVVATLVEDPQARKEFSFVTKARVELRLGPKRIKSGESVIKVVNWNGEKKQALIKVL